MHLRPGVTTRSCTVTVSRPDEVPPHVAHLSGSHIVNLAQIRNGTNDSREPIEQRCDVRGGLAPVERGRQRTFPNQHVRLVNADGFREPRHRTGKRRFTRRTGRCKPDRAAIRLMLLPNLANRKAGPRRQIECHDDRASRHWSAREAVAFALFGVGDLKRPVSDRCGPVGQQLDSFG